jgi:hypothetical protein
MKIVLGHACQLPTEDVCPKKRSNGEPKFVREAVVEGCRWVLRASCRTDAKNSSDKASEIASSDSLRIGLSEGWDVFGLEKLGLRREYVRVLEDFASRLSMATRSLWTSTAFKPFRLRYIRIDC